MRGQYPDGVTGDDSPSRSALPSGSVVPGADIWDDDDDLDMEIDMEIDLDIDLSVADLSERREHDLADAADAEWEDEAWLQDAHVVAHVDDDGVHDGSRGVEADDDETTEAFGTKMQRWGTSSMLGVTLSGIGFGIDKVLNPRESTQIEIQVDDESDDHLDPVEVKLGEDPEHSIAVLRPWLRDRGGHQDG